MLLRNREREELATAKRVTTLEGDEKAYFVRRLRAGQAKASPPVAFVDQSTRDKGVRSATYGSAAAYAAGRWNACHSRPCDRGAHVGVGRRGSTPDGPHG